MKFRKILLLGYIKGDLGEVQEKRLGTLGQEVVMLPKESKDSAKHLVDTDCLLVRLGAIVDREMIDRAPKLKYIGMLGTGYGRIDVVYATKKGITVCNIAGYSTQAVAELVFGMLLEHIRELTRAKLQARGGDYSETTFGGYEIKNKKFGVIGFGRIGQKVAHIADGGFGAQVQYWSKHRKKNAEKKGIAYKPLETILKECDFISINLALAPQTNGILDKKKIELIKPGAVVVNVAPMELIDIDVLIVRLKRGDIIFILDHSDELAPVDAKKLARLPNCIMYPPIGYITREATQAKLGMFVDNVENFLKETPTNKVN